MSGVERMWWESRKLRWVVGLSVVVLVMLSFVAWSPELYRVFCDVTGYGGGTQRVVSEGVGLKEATGEGEGVLLPEVTVYFDANTDKRLPWRFSPEQRSVKVRVGETKQIFYRAYNPSQKRIVGQATFNVLPFVSGSYFYKAECFCFSNQVLEPGEEARMPVVFYVEEGMLEDEETKDIREITLSYTFYRLKDLEAEGGEGHGGDGGHGDEGEELHDLKDTGRDRKESFEKGDEQEFNAAGVRRS